MGIVYSNMNKKTFEVIWSERMSVNVEAETKEEAEQMIHDSDYQDDQVGSEIDSQPEAFELDLK